MTGQYRRRAGEPVDVWEVGTEPVPEWVDGAWAIYDGSWYVRSLRSSVPLGWYVVRGLMRAYSPDEFRHNYEPVPSPDVHAVLGTPEGNAAVVAKLHEMAESVGAVFVPDPDKLARCGGLPSPEALEPESEAEWDLELRAFHAAGRADVPEDVQQTVQDLWREVVAREPVPSNVREALADEVVSGLYRRFKEWRKRDFTEDDVTWCEVKADIEKLIDAALARIGGGNAE